MHKDCCKEARKECIIKEHNRAGQKWYNYCDEIRRKRKNQTVVDFVHIDSDDDELIRIGTADSAKYCTLLDEYLLLNDEVINSYMKLLNALHLSQNDPPRFFATSTFLYPELQKFRRQSKETSRFTYEKFLPKDDDIVSYDKLVSPDNLFNMHWVLVVVSLLSFEITIFNSSLKDDNDPIYIKIFNNFSRLLRRIFECSDQMSMNQMVDKDIPQQKNDKDCGVFVCKFAKDIFEPHTHKFSQDSEVLRKEIVCDFSRLTLEKLKSNTLLKQYVWLADDASNSFSETDNNDGYVSLCQQVTGAGLEFRKAVPMDGNCFFHAVSDQLQRVSGQKYTAKELRKQCVDYLTQNSELEDGMKLEEFVTESFKSYLEKMEKDGSWADWLMIFAAVNLLNRPISIISSIGEDGLRIIEPLSSFGKRRQALLLGHLAEVHYYSLQS